MSMNDLSYARARPLPVDLRTMTMTISRTRLLRYSLLVRVLDYSPHIRFGPKWSFPVTVGFTILAIRTVLLSAIVLFIRVISCDIVYI